MSSVSQQQRRSWQFLLSWALPCLTAVTLLGILAWPLLNWWNWEYTRPESHYGHGYFVPVLAALMLWHRRAAIQQAIVESQESGIQGRPAALLILLPSLALFVMARNVHMEAVMSATFLIALTSAIWFVVGTRVLRAAAVPLAFLWLMAPLPGPLLNDGTLGMQSFSTAAGEWLLRSIGFSPVREGSRILLENFTLDVDVPCSGFNLLLRLVTFCIAFVDLSGYRPELTSRDVWRRKAVLLMIVVPLAILINGVRIAMIGIAGECFGASMGVAFHDWSGLIALVLCMAALFAVAKGLGCRTLAGQSIC